MRFESTVSGYHLIIFFKHIDIDFAFNRPHFISHLKIKMDEDERQFILEVTRPRDELKARWRGVVGLDGDTIIDTRDTHNDNEGDGLKRRWTGIVGLDGDM